MENMFRKLIRGKAVIEKKSTETLMTRKNKIGLVLISLMLLGFGTFFLTGNPEKYGDARDNMTAEQIEFHKKNAEFYESF